MKTQNIVLVGMRLHRVRVSEKGLSKFFLFCFNASSWCVFSGFDKNPDFV